MKKLDHLASYWKSRLNGVVIDAPAEFLFFPSLLTIGLQCERILEVGVANGRMVRILKENGVVATFHGIDLNDNVRNSGAIGLIGDARVLPYADNMFDLVYSLGVVEHFSETKLAVLEHARVVKRGGHVLITTPHLYVFTPRRYLDYFLHERKFGSFEEVRGRNIRLNVMKRYFMEAGLLIKECGVYGTSNFRGLLEKAGLHKLQQMLHKKVWAGAYLYVIGMKQ